MSSAGAAGAAAAWCLVQLRRRQPVATPVTMGVVTGGIFLACSVYGGLAAAMRHDAPHRGALALLMVACAVTGVLVLALRRHLGTPVYHLLYASGVVVIALSARLDSEASAAAGVADASLVVLLAVIALFFFPAATGSVHLLVAMAAAAWALRGTGATAADVLLLEVTWVLVALLVGHLSRATRTAEVDDLTGLANRRGFERAAASALVHRRAGRALSLALLDLDHFKAVNDTLGHAAGDDVLRATGRAWEPLVPAGALLGRWGGDEFVLLVPQDLPGAGRVVAALRAALPPGRSTTAGLAPVRPGEPLEAAMRRADEALYTAKRACRGTTGVWSPGSERAGDAAAAGQPWLESHPSMRSDSGSSGSSAPPASSGASSRSMPTAAS